MKLVIRPRAAADLKRAYDFYERHRHGRGEQVATAVWETIEAALEHPQRFPVHRRNTRRALVRRFPYFVIYRVSGEALIVVRIFHSSSDSSRWEEGG